MSADDVPLPPALGQPASEPHQAPVLGQPPSDSSPVLGEPLFPNGLQKEDVTVDDALVPPAGLAASSVNGVHADHVSSDSSPEDFSAAENTTPPVSQESDAPLVSSVESTAAAAEETCDEPVDKECGAASSDGAQETVVACSESDQPLVEERAVASDEVASGDRKEEESQVHGDDEEPAAQEVDQKEAKEEEDSKASDAVLESSPTENKISAEEKEVAENPDCTSEKDVPAETQTSSEANYKKDDERTIAIKDASSYGTAETVASSEDNAEVASETEKPSAEEVVDEKQHHRELTEEDFQKQNNETEYGSATARGEESLQYGERALLAANGENGFQCVGDADPSSAEEKGQDVSNEKEQWSLRFVKLPLIFTGLAIAAAGIAFTSFSRASLGSK